MHYIVTVLHNVSEDIFIRYNPETSKLFHAHDFQVIADDMEAAANMVWTLANIDSGESLRELAPNLSMYASQVDEYRARKNRSLSMSDVLLFTEWDYPNIHRKVGALSIEMIGHKSVGWPEFRAGSNETLTSQSYEAHRLFHESHNARRN